MLTASMPTYGRSRIVLRQGMDIKKVVSSSNTNYIIKDNIDLGGRTIVIGDNSLLIFQGGSFSNGKVVGNNTRIRAKNEEIFKHGRRLFRGYTIDGKYQFVAKDENTISIDGSWNNQNCGEKWTGMDSFSEKDCAGLAINNFIRLHKPKTRIIFPAGKKYYVYEPIKCSGYSVDFNGSIIRSIDFDAVEDTSIRIPEGAKPCELRSLYGLVVFQGNGLELKNLTVDGRSSSRKEVPILGSECLLSMSSNLNCLLENIILKDAVGCGICTYTISGCKFNGLKVSDCGEHGLYTHAYNGDLYFNDCHFHNCGQDDKLYAKRGMSACIKFSGSRDRDYSELKTLRAFFHNCIFQCEGKYSVATTYADLPYAEFDHCQWIGNVKGYSVASEDLAVKTGRLVEYKFIDCINPCSKIQSVNTIRRLIRCTGVIDPFADAVELNDCEIVASYSDTEYKYTKSFSSQYEVPVFFINCKFVKTVGDISIRNTVNKPRPMVFRHCEWNYSVSEIKKNSGSYYLVLVNPSKDRTNPLSIKFDACRFDFGRYRMLSCNDAVIEMDDCSYVSSYGSLIDANVHKPNKIRIRNLNNQRNLAVARNYIEINR